MTKHQKQACLSHINGPVKITVGDLKGVVRLIVAMHSKGLCPESLVQHQSEGTLYTEMRCKMSELPDLGHSKPGTWADLTVKEHLIGDDAEFGYNIHGENHCFADGIYDPDVAVSNAIETTKSCIVREIANNLRFCAT